MTEREQRWREGSTRWVQPGRPYFDPDRYRVEVIPWRSAVDFVVQHHYSGSYPQILERHGMIDKKTERLVGVATFGGGGGPHVTRKWLPTPGDVFELNRFVLLDEVGFNAETWALGKSFQLLLKSRPKTTGLLAMSDPFPRTTVDGETVMPGHVGQIYQGHNAVLLGRSDSAIIWLDDQGREISMRAASKLDKERGGDGFYRRFRQAGAPPRRRGEKARAYLKRALETGPFRPMEHPGKYVYVWDRIGAKGSRGWIKTLSKKIDTLRDAAFHGETNARIRRLGNELDVPDHIVQQILQGRESAMETGDLSLIPGPAEFSLVPQPFPSRGTGRVGSRKLELSKLSI